MRLLHPFFRGSLTNLAYKGTFTDICVITPEGRTVRAKVPTDTADQSVGVKRGVDQVRKILKEQEGWDGKFEHVKQSRLS